MSSHWAVIPASVALPYAAIQHTPQGVHQQTHALQDQATVAPTSTPQLSCRQCAQACGSQSALRRHMNTVCGSQAAEQPFACSLCPKAFRRKDALQRHRSTHDRSGWPACPDCGLVARPDYMKLHLQAACRKTLRRVNPNVRKAIDIPRPAPRRHVFPSGAQISAMASRIGYPASGIVWNMGARTAPHSLAASDNVSLVVGERANHGSDSERKKSFNESGGAKKLIMLFTFALLYSGSSQQDGDDQLAAQGCRPARSRQLRIGKPGIMTCTVLAAVLEWYSRASQEGLKGSGWLTSANQAPFWTCRLCDMHLVSARMIPLHVSSHLNSLGQLSHRCPTCNIGFAHAARFRKHRSNTQRGRLSSECEGLQISDDDDWIQRAWRVEFESNIRAQEGVDLVRCVRSWYLEFRQRGPERTDCELDVLSGVLCYGNSVASVDRQAEHCVDDITIAFTTLTLVTAAAASD